MLHRDGRCPANHSSVWVPLCHGWVIGPSSIYACSNGLHAAFTSQDAYPVSPAGPLQRCPYNYQPSASTVVLPPGKRWVENQSHQQLRSTEKMNVAVLNQPKMQRKISLPLQRERVREREWAKPESSGALPKPLEACDRSLFYPSTREIGSMCLIHSWTVSDSNSYLYRDAVKHIRIEWFVLYIYTHRHTHTHIYTLLTALAL